MHTVVAEAGNWAYRRTALPPNRIGNDPCKWCYKLGPLIDSEPLVDCLELAARAREPDMRARPCELRGYGYAPIAIERPAGRGQYVRTQLDIAQRAAPLRDALGDRCEVLVAALQ
jgi:hypothetical protein